MNYYKSASHTTVPLSRGSGPNDWSTSTDRGWRNSHAYVLGDVFRWWAHWICGSWWEYRVHVHWYMLVCMYISVGLLQPSKLLPDWVCWHHRIVAFFNRTITRFWNWKRIIFSHNWSHIPRLSFLEILLKCRFQCADWQVEERCASACSDLSCEATLSLKMIAS